jgi:hypothetical protein
MEQVARLVGPADLPREHRRASVRRLFQRADGRHEERPDEGGLDADRFAQVAASEPPTFLDLGSPVRVESAPEAGIEPIPPLLATVARRWGWAGLLRDGEGWRILLDAPALAALAAPRRPT